MLNRLDGPGTRSQKDEHTISGYFGRISPEIPTRDKGLLGFRLLKGLTALIFGSLRIFYAQMPPARTVKCRFCRKEFYKKANLHRHWMQNQCSNNPNPRHVKPRCLHCHAEFSCNASLKLHLSRNQCRVIRQQQIAPVLAQQPQQPPNPPPQPPNPGMMDDASSDDE